MNRNEDFPYGPRNLRCKPTKRVVVGHYVLQIFASPGLSYSQSVWMTCFAESLERRPHLGDIEGD